MTTILSNQQKVEIANHYVKFASDVYENKIVQITKYNKQTMSHEEVLYDGNKIINDVEYNESNLKNASGDIEYKFYFDQQKNELIIAFQGTVSISDWMNNAAGAVDNFVNENVLGKINSDLTIYIENLKNKGLLENNNISFVSTGHSQGGAYAELFSMSKDLKSTLEDNNLNRLENRLFTYNGLGTNHFNNKDSLLNEKLVSMGIHFSHKKDLVSYISQHKETPQTEHMFFDDTVGNPELQFSNLGIFTYHYINYISSEYNYSEKEPLFSVENITTGLREPNNLEGYYSEILSSLPTLMNDANEQIELGGVVLGLSIVAQIINQFKEIESLPDAEKPDAEKKAMGTYTTLLTLIDVIDKASPDHTGSIKELIHYVKNVLPENSSPSDFVENVELLTQKMFTTEALFESVIGEISENKTTYEITNFFKESYEKAYKVIFGAGKMSYDLVYSNLLDLAGLMKVTTDGGTDLHLETFNFIFNTVGLVAFEDTEEKEKVYEILTEMIFKEAIEEHIDVAINFNESLLTEYRASAGDLGVFEEIYSESFEYINENINKNDLKKQAREYFFENPKSSSIIDFIGEAYLNVQKDAFNEMKIKAEEFLETLKTDLKELETQYVSEKYLTFKDAIEVKKEKNFMQSFKYEKLEDNFNESMSILLGSTSYETEIYQYEILMDKYEDLFKLDTINSFVALNKIEELQDLFEHLEKKQLLLSDFETKADEILSNYLSKLELIGDFTEPVAEVPNEHDILEVDLKYKDITTITDEDSGEIIEQQETMKTVNLETSGESYFNENLNYKKEKYEYKKIKGGDGDNNILLSNSKYSGVELGEGNNVVTVENSNAAGLNLGSGNNEIKTSSVQELNATIGDGNNIIKTNDSKLVNINIGDGNNDIDLNTIDGLNLTVLDGNNKIKVALNDNEEESNIKVGLGYNDINIEGNNINLELGKHGDSLTLNEDVSDKVIISGENADIKTWGKDIDLTINGSESNVDLGEGNNDLKIKSQDIKLEENENISFAETPSTETNTKINLGEGNNKTEVFNDSSLELTTGNGTNEIYIENSKKININTGNKNDLITINNSEDLNINLNEGNDMVVGEGMEKNKIKTEKEQELFSPKVYINTGKGDDTVYLGGIQNARILTGEGDDIIFDSENAAEYVFDSYNGKDVLHLKENKETESFDIINLNTFNLSGLAFELINNKEILIKTSNFIEENSIFLKDVSIDNLLDKEYNEKFLFKIGGLDYSSNEFALNVLNKINKGTDYDDRIISREIENEITGGKGNDLLVGNNLSDKIDGGSGNNHIEGGYGDDTLSANDGNNIIKGGHGNDNINVGNGNNNISSFQGNNIVRFGYGNNTVSLKYIDLPDNLGELPSIYSKVDGDIVGGNGNNIISIENKSSIIGDSNIYLGDGSNQVFLKNTNSDINLGDGINQIVSTEIMGDSTENEIIESNITIGDGNNHISLKNSDSILNLGNGNNYILANGLNDYYKNNMFKIDLGEGDNVIEGSNSKYDIEAKNGNNFIKLSGTTTGKINLGNGSNVIKSENGDLNIKTGLGDDDINIGAGNSIIDAGEGNNRVISYSGKSIINTGSGSDYITINKAASNIYSGSGDDYVEYEINNYFGIPIIETGLGNDYLSVTMGSAYINTGKGNDVIVGTSDDKEIYYKKGDGHDILDLGIFRGTMNFSNISKNDISFSVLGDSLKISFFDNQEDSGSVTFKDWFLKNNENSNGNFVFSDGTLSVEDLTIKFLNEFKIKSIGTEEDDHILGDKNYGNDIEGNSGNDYIEGGDAYDIINGGNGNDTIYGGAGKDIINGGNGNDVIDSGNPWIEKENGYSSKESENEIDIINGGNGDDTINVEINDVIIFESKEEIAAGHDVVYGENDIDVQLHISDSSKVFYIKEQNNLIIEIKQNNGREDSIKLSNWFSDMDSNNDVTIIRDSNPAVYISPSFIENNLIIDGIGKIKGSNGNDTLNGYEDLRNEIYGSNGNDTTYGGKKADDIYGEEGDDVIFGYAGADYIKGGSGEDIINGGLGDDYIDGGEGTDTIMFETDGSSDTIHNANGDNIEIILTEENADVKYYEFGSNIVIETVVNEVKSQLIIQDWYSDFEQQIPNQIKIINFDGSEVILTPEDIESLKQPYPKVTLNGTDGDDFLGAEGNNIINAGAGNDFIDELGGDDIINAGDGDDYIEDWSGNDVINGEGGNDNINAGEGNDIINGGSGNDHIITGAGDDIVDGGEGIDTIVYESSLWANGGNDVIHNSNNDKIELIVDLSEFSLEYNKQENNLVIAITRNDGNTDSLTFENWFDDTNPQRPSEIKLVNSNDYTHTMLSITDITNMFASTHVLIEGTENNDYLGGDEDNIINAGAGNDFIDDWFGNDIVNAGSGNDVIEVWAGNNIINADEGDDSVNVGDGNDKINGGSGNDYINSNGGDDVINGGSGNDEIRNGAGNDVVDGGEGTDIIIFEMNDFLNGGHDTIKNVNGDNVHLLLNRKDGIVSYSKNENHLIIQVELNTNTASLTIENWFDEASPQRPNEMRFFDWGGDYSEEVISNDVITELALNPPLDATMSTFSEESQFDLLTQEMSSFGAGDEDISDLPVYAFNPEIPTND